MGDSGLGMAVIARRRLHESRIPNPEFRLSIVPLLRRQDVDVVVEGGHVHRALFAAGFALVPDPAQAGLLPLPVCSLGADPRALAAPRPFADSGGAPGRPRL